MDARPASTASTKTKTTATATRTTPTFNISATKTTTSLPQFAATAGTYSAPTAEVSQ